MSSAARASSLSSLTSLRGLTSSICRSSRYWSQLQVLGRPAMAAAVEASANQDGKHATRKYSATASLQARQRRPIGMKEPIDSGGRVIQSPVDVADKMQFPERPDGSTSRERQRRALRPSAALDKLPDPESLLAALRGVQSEALRMQQRSTDVVLRRIRSGQAVDPSLAEREGLLGDLAETANGIAEIRAGMQQEFAQAVAMERQSDAAQLVRAIREQMRTEGEGEGTVDPKSQQALDEALERVVMGDDGAAAAAMQAVRAGEGAVEACLRSVEAAVQEQESARKEIRSEWAATADTDEHAGEDGIEFHPASIEYELMQRRHNEKCYGSPDASEENAEGVLPPGAIRFQEALLARRLEMLENVRVQQGGRTIQQTMRQFEAVADASRQTLMQVEAAPLSPEQREELDKITQDIEQQAQAGRKAAVQALEGAMERLHEDLPYSTMEETDKAMRLVPKAHETDSAASEVFGPLMQELEAAAEKGGGPNTGRALARAVSRAAQVRALMLLNIVADVAEWGPAREGTGAEAAVSKEAQPPSDEESKAPRGSFEAVQYRSAEDQMVMACCDPMPSAPGQPDGFYQSALAKRAKRAAELAQEALAKLGQTSLEQAKAAGAEQVQLQEAEVSMDLAREAGVLLHEVLAAAEGGGAFSSTGGLSQGAKASLDSLRSTAARLLSEGFEVVDPREADLFEEQQFEAARKGQSIEDRRARWERKLQLATESLGDARDAGDAEAAEASASHTRRLLARHAIEVLSADRDLASAWRQLALDVPLELKRMDDALLEAGYEVAVSMVRYQDVVNAKKRASRTLQPDELQQLPEFLRRRMVATAGRHSASDQIVAARFGVGPLVSRPDEMDPLFSLNSAALDEIRRMPEPFRSKLLDRLVWSLPPEAVLDVARYDEEIAEHIRRERVRRMAGLDGEEHGDKQGAPGLPYASRVQYDSRYFTHETEPSRHHPVADRGLYCLLARDAGEMEALVPEGVPRSLKVEFDATARRAVMLRAESLALGEALDQFARETEGLSEEQGDQRASQVAAWAQQQREAISSWESRSQDPRGRALPARPAKDGRRHVVAYEEDMEAGARPVATSAAGVQWHPLQGGVHSKAAGAGAAGGAASGSGEGQSAVPSLPPFTMLAGPRDSGKSAALLYAVHRARQSGWVALFVPDSFSWLNDAVMVTASEARPGKLDQPDLSAELLAHMLSAHADQLGQVVQRRSYRVGEYLPSDADEEVRRKKEELRAADLSERARRQAEASQRGEDAADVTIESQLEAFEEGPDHDRKGEGYTLRDLCEWGVRHPGRASDAVVDLVEELRLCVEFPVLLAVDGVNELYEKSVYPFAGRHWWPGQALSVPSTIAPFDAKGPRGEALAMRRGVVLCSSTSTHRKVHEMSHRTKVPSSCVLRMPRMSRREVHNQLLHYHMTGRFLSLRFRQDVDAEAVETFRTLSSGIPGQVREAALQVL